MAKGHLPVNNDLKKVNLQSYSGSVCSGSPFRMWDTPVCVCRECARHVHRRDTQDHSHELHRAATLPPPTSEQLLLCSRKPATFHILNTLNLLNYPCKQNRQCKLHRSTMPLRIIPICKVLWNPTWVFSTVCFLKLGTNYSDWRPLIILSSSSYEI